LNQHLYRCAGFTKKQQLLIEDEMEVGASDFHTAKYLLAECTVVLYKDLEAHQTAVLEHGEVGHNPERVPYMPSFESTISYIVLSPVCMKMGSGARQEFAGEFR
jgi:hypothetical protein